MTVTPQSGRTTRWRTNGASGQHGEHRARPDRELAAEASDTRLGKVAGTGKIVVT